MTKHYFRRRHRMAAWRLAALVLACVAASAPPWPACADESEEAAGAQAVASHFVLVTHDGRTVTDDDFHGKHLIVFFGYTSCPDVCPTSLQKLAVAMGLLGPLADKVQPLFVTLDPERDTPAVLNDYVSSFGHRIIGLTGSREMIDRMAKAYRVKHERIEGASPGEYSIDHTAALFHIAPDGSYAGRFSAAMDAEQIADAMRKSLATN